jgi:formamidopyrimidine-DNA glycosylase
VIELPEAATHADQATKALTGRTVVYAEANHTPHKLMWFFGDPAAYRDLLVGRTITGARAVAGLVQIEADDLRILFSDGAYPRLHAPGEPLPAKHQLRLDLDDGATLVATVAMYGGVQVFHDGENDSPYYAVALAKPSPLTPAFDAGWFDGLLAADGADRLSAKAFLATEQRIPGLGNGVLQDILWTAGVHPKRKMGTLSDGDRADLFDAVTTTLRAMAQAGGRDTERDLFGRPGGYPTVMCRTTLELPCPRCGGRRVKEPYLGGAVYFCAGCQAP